MATKKKTSAKKTENAGADRQKALDAAMAMIEKDYGKGAVMRLGNDALQFKLFLREIPQSTLPWALVVSRAGAL